MAWRGSTTVQDRIFACLPYLLPLMHGLTFGVFLLQEFPVLQYLFLPLIPLLQIYSSIPFASLIVFFALYLLVVRNESISHFIRFNTMQAIMIDIVIFLCSLLLRILMPIPGASFATQTISSTIFLGIVAAVAFAVTQSLRGKYAEIPALSEAVHMQVR
jgi:Chloroplast import apparatus Tic20-like